MPAKSLGAPLQILPCFAISPSPPQNNVVLWSKIGMIWDDPRLCWNAGTITFEINIVSGARGYLNLMAMVRNADYEEMA